MYIKLDLLTKRIIVVLGHLNPFEILPEKNEKIIYLINILNNTQ